MCRVCCCCVCCVSSTAYIYPLSLHDALPIFGRGGEARRPPAPALRRRGGEGDGGWRQGAVPAGGVAAVGVKAASRAIGTVPVARSEEHTSELQSRSDLVCRLLLEKKK